jgi:hypothetical protein
LMVKSGGERYLNWDDFNRVCIARGMPPSIFSQLRRTYRTYCEGGCDLTTLKWFFTRWAPWVVIVSVQADEDLDYIKKNVPPLVFYPSNLLSQGFCCENLPSIFWAYGDRGQGKSVASYGIAEQWLNEAKEWSLSEEYGSPRVYVYGDVNGYVPNEPGWFRCPDWFQTDRHKAEFPLLEVYDEVPLQLRSGAVSKASKEWAEKLTRSRHYNVWTIMNMVQAKMASKRGREMDALTLDRFSGLRQLRERIEDMPLKALRQAYRKIIPEMRRNDPGLALTQLNEDQGEPGTWLTFYETKTTSWFEWREELKKKRSLAASAAPWPPDCVLQRLFQLSQPIMDEIAKRLDEDDFVMLFNDTLSIIPTEDNLEEVRDRIHRQILRGAKMEWAAIGEVLHGVEARNKEKMGGGGPLQRWGHRNPFKNSPEQIQNAAKILLDEMPITNRKPFLWISKG